MPQKFYPPSELLDLQPLPIAQLKNKRFEEALFSHLVEKVGSRGYFNPIQTQTFTQLYETDNNVLVCAPPGSGKTVCAEFAILRMLLTAKSGTKPRCVYITAVPDIASIRFNDWERRFGRLGEVVQLTGETAADLKLRARADCHSYSRAMGYDISSLEAAKKCSVCFLFIVDDIHLTWRRPGTNPRGRCFSHALRSFTVGIGGHKHGAHCQGASIANAKDVGSWLGTTNHALFAFHPQVRPVPLDLTIQGFEISHFGSV